MTPKFFQLVPILVVFSFYIQAHNAVSVKAANSKFSIRDTSSSVHQLSGPLPCFVRNPVPSNCWSNLIRVPGWFGSENAGGGIAFLEGAIQGTTDILVAHIDNPSGENAGYYRIGKNVRRGSSGTLYSVHEWRGPYRVPGWFGGSNAGSGIAAGSIRTGSRDVVFFSIDNPRGENRGYYRVGFGMDANGVVRHGWTHPIRVPGWFGSENSGSAIALGRIRSSLSTDLVVAHIDNPRGANSAYYRVGFGINYHGHASHWSGVYKIPGWFGSSNQGLGVSLLDIDRNGQLDIIVHHIDNPRGANSGYFRVGLNLNSHGQVTGGWLGPRRVPGWFGSEDHGAGISAHRLGDGSNAVAVFHIDNPRGGNSGYIRFAPF